MTEKLYQKSIFVPKIRGFVVEISQVAGEIDNNSGPFYSGPWDLIGLILRFVASGEIRKPRIRHTLR